MVLDNIQKRAVETNKKEVLVVAGPGSGKTRVIVERLKFLLDNGVDPSGIYAITYTNTAAQEMRNRLNNSDVFIGTIHSLANRILLINGIDTTNILEEEQFDELFELMKDRDIAIPKITHLLVDEFQDICDNEYEFMIETLEPKAYFLVGDPCQSIYSFKGGNYKHFIHLMENPFVYTYELNNNYRCGKNIIEYSKKFLNELYQSSIDSVCKSNLEGVVIEEALDLDLILDYLKDEDYRDWFILCRKNSEVESILNFLQKNDIPCINFRKSELTLEELNKVIDDNLVKVLTIHSAKGLESKNVMVIGGINWNQEEIRICYVAATRAKEKLVWFNGKIKPKKINYNMTNWN